MNTKRFFVAAAAAVTIAALTCGPAGAQSYPTKPVRLMIPFAPGGIFDYIARVVSPKLSESMGHTVVVDNRAGGGGVIAMSTVSKAAPDGYTVLLADPSFVINLSLQQKPGYALQEFTPVTVLTTAALVLVVHSKVPAKSMQELINLSKTQKLSYGSAGPGTTPHIAGELFKSRTRAEILHVPFRGAGPAVAAVLGEQVDLTFGSVAAVQGVVRDGRLRALATTGEKRATAMPSVPTIAESGYPGYEVSVWATVFVPVGTPRDIVAKLNTEFVQSLKDPTVKAGLDKQAIEPLGTTPAEASKFVQREFVKFADVIKKADIRIE